MTDSERAFTFNPSAESIGVHIPPRLGEVTFTETSLSDDPEKPASEQARNTAQSEKISDLVQRLRQQSEAQFKTLDHRSLDENALFEERASLTDLQLAKMFNVTTEAIETALQWAYRCYKVDPHDATRFSASPSGRRFQDYIYLFNVLIALEYEPNQRDLRLLARAARNASSFLFDVTDGWMAFGQVVVGGPELMDCADIQIMASNRLLPRSWVGGLHEAKKYMPIRLGRGLWNKDNRVSIAWNEPEGYRVLIHEWAHYALELLDAYLETDSIYSQDNVLKLKSPQQAQRVDTQVVVPKICLPVESIMDSMQGTSELVPKQHGQHKQSEWERIIAGMYRPRFPRIKSQPERIDGSLPLQDLPFMTRLVTKTTTAPDYVSELLLFDVPPYINHEHCWVYLLRSHNGTPSRIIAQGTLDARLDQGFRLLGAELGDEIVLIGDAIGDSGRREIVQRGQIQTIEPIGDPRRDRWQMGDAPYEAIVKWERCDPDMAIPAVEIVAQAVGRHDDSTTRIAVRVPGVQQEQVQITLFPLDRPQSIALAEGQASAEPVALDGHVLVSWGDFGQQLIVVNYSQGGGPPTGSPVGATPMTAGS